VAVASAGPYASLHLALDKYLRQHPTTQFFTGLMPFLPPNQHHQNTEGKDLGRLKQKNENRLEWLCQSVVVAAAVIIRPHHSTTYVNAAYF